MPPPTNKTEMVMRVGEGFSIQEVAEIVAECVHVGGRIIKICFMGIKPSPTLALNPNEVKVQGMYSVIWMVPKTEESQGVPQN